MTAKSVSVIGGGLVGAAIAYGMARLGATVRMLDQGDDAFRASRGNFGLVWVQGKGGALPRYAQWSRDAVKLWPELHRELLELTGVDSGLRQPGGFWIGFSDEEVRQRAELLARLNMAAGEIPFQLMDRKELAEHVPGLGRDVVGGSFCPLDGDANPLMLLRGLHSALKHKGADIISGVEVSEIRALSDFAGFDIVSRDEQRWRSDLVIIAAGLGTPGLASQVGLSVPIQPLRGQVLITERLKPFLRYPMNKTRQTAEGTVQIGSSSEEVGFNDQTTPDVIERLARRAVQTFPALSDARLVRAWGALRPLTPDGFPVYQESIQCPGAFVATSHSGVTLAAAHCFVIAPWMLGVHERPSGFDVFQSDRISLISGEVRYGH